MKRTLRQARRTLALRLSLTDYRPDWRLLYEALGTEDDRAADAETTDAEVAQGWPHDSTRPGSTGSAN